jgi:hypothetical protein
LKNKLLHKNIQINESPRSVMNGDFSFGAISCRIAINFSSGFRCKPSYFGAFHSIQQPIIKTIVFNFSHSDVKLHLFIFPISTINFPNCYKHWIGREIFLCSCNLIIIQHNLFSTQLIYEVYSKRHSS